MIHFIGIGGIGVSALAKYYLEKGYKISGSDLVSSEITEALKKKGAKIFIGPHQKCLKWKFKQLPDLVIYSPAVQKSNPELKKAKKFKIKTQSYPQALGELTKKYFTVAVSGTHGKSTTVAMIGILLTKAGLDPTVIVGTKVKEFQDSTRSTSSGLILNHAEGSNCRVGESKYLVIEACEHEESFLNYWPQIAVITNIEREHLDYYKNLTNILKAFRKFISHLPPDGILVVNKDDKNISKLYNTFQPIGKNVLHYSLSNREGRKLKKILKVPGEHSIYNALAALTVAKILKIPDKISFKALSEYRGTWRRFETKKFKMPNSKNKIIVINDYAHHPTEIKATLRATREKFPKKKIWAVFQPHQYQRTFYLFKEFIKVLSAVSVDKLIITDIYDVAGREQRIIKKNVSSQKLAEKVKNRTKNEVMYIPTIKKTAHYLKKNLKGGEVIIIMGAGDIYKLIDAFPLDIK